jgi:hypothetical protein
MNDRAQTEILSQAEESVTQPLTELSIYHVQLLTIIELIKLNVLSATREIFPYKTKVSYQWNTNSASSSK